MPVTKLGDKRYYLGVFFKVSSTTTLQLAESRLSRLNYRPNTDTVTSWSGGWTDALEIFQSRYDVRVTFKEKFKALTIDYSLWPVWYAPPWLGFWFLFGRQPSTTISCAEVPQPMPWRGWYLIMACWLVWFTGKMGCGLYDKFESFILKRLCQPKK